MEETKLQRDNRRRRERYAASAEYRERVYQQVRAYRDRPEKIELRRQRNRAKHKFFPHELVALRRLEQEGRCAICPTVLDTNVRRGNLAGEQADHNDVTKQPRALLCGGCNRALGFYERHQRPAGLRIAQYEEYLAKFDDSYKPTRSDG
jgi:Recombination endonuclease VII